MSLSLTLSLTLSLMLRLTYLVLAGCRWTWTWTWSITVSTIGIQSDQLRPSTSKYDQVWLWLTMSMTNCDQQWPGLTRYAQHWPTATKFDQLLPSMTNLPNIIKYHQVWPCQAFQKIWNAVSSRPTGGQFLRILEGLFRDGLKERFKWMDHTWISLFLLGKMSPFHSVFLPCFCISRVNDLRSRSTS